MYIELFLIITIVLYLFLKFFIYKKFGFWAYQPVFHYFNILYWIYPIGVVNNKLPKVNKFCNFLNVITNEFELIDEKLISDNVEFIQNNYYNNNYSKYLPSIIEFQENLKCNNYKTIISNYYLYNGINTNNTNNINNKKIIGIITSKPLNMNIYNKYYRIYYVDNLCIDKDHRKKNIAPELIQTHEYMHSHKNNKFQISLFKREGELTGIVYLTKYINYQYSIDDINRFYLKKNNINILKINKKNITLLITLLNEKRNKFDCFIISDLSNLINLINNDIYNIYGIVINNKLMSCYFFKNSNMYYYNDIDLSFNIKSLEFFASINNTNNSIFVSGFINSLYEINKSNYKYLIIDNISHNNIILDDFKNKNINDCYKNKNAFFLYNYIERPINSNSVFIIS